jgi:hypothetical protein
MSAFHRSALALIAMTLFPIAIGQTNPPHYRAVFAGPFTFVRPGITGAPFSIEQVAELMIRYSDGHRSPRAGREWLYRDSQGRTRCERPIPNPGGDPNIRIVQIVDPIAGHQYVIDTVNKVAHRIIVPLIPPPMLNSLESKPPLPSIEEMSMKSFHRDILIVENLADAPPRITSENIGNRIIEGIQTRGVRTIIEYPAAASTAPATLISTEAWVSDELKVVVFSTRHDSKWGDSMARLVKVSTAEPDESLFRPPPDYWIVDEPGTFIIDITLPVQDTR